MRGGSWIRTMATLVDAHVHLPMSAATRQCAAEAGVRACVVCSTDVASWGAVLQAACSPTPSLHASLGVHPWWAGGAGPPESVRVQLLAALRASPTASVGEIGLDRGRRGLEASSMEAQLHLFRLQLQVASELGRAVSLHCVQAHTELADEVCDHVASLPSSHPGWPGLTGVLLHSWGGPPAVVHRLRAALPAHVPLVASFQGSIVVSASNAWVEHQVRGVDVHALPRGASKAALACVATLPTPLLAIETDSPDQPFVHATHAGYVAWAEAVLPWPGGALEPASGGDASTSQANSPALLVHVWRALTLLRADHALDTRTGKDRARGVPRPPSLFSIADLGSRCGNGGGGVLDGVRALGEELARGTSANTLRVFRAWATQRGLLDTDGRVVVTP